MYFDSIHRIGIVILRPLLNYHDACINWLASHRFVTNLRNPAYHESHQTLSTWVMLPTYHRSSFAAGQTVYFFLHCRQYYYQTDWLTACLAVLITVRCYSLHMQVYTSLFPPHAGVYVAIPPTYMVHQTLKCSITEKPSIILKGQVVCLVTRTVIVHTLSVAYM